MKLYGWEMIFEMKSNILTEQHGEGESVSAETPVGSRITEKGFSRVLRLLLQIPKVGRSRVTEGGLLTHTHTRTRLSIQINARLERIH